MRYDVASDGNLINGRVYGPDILGETAAPDGVALDSEGNLWVAIVSRNGLCVITPDERLHCVFEDPSSDALTLWLEHYKMGRIPTKAMRDCAGATLQLPTSVAFGGPDLQTVFMGSLGMPHLLTFRSPIPGLPLAHQHRETPPSAALRMI